MNGKQKIIISLILFFVAAGLLIGYGFYAETTKIVDFNEFTIETPQMCEFEDISSRYNSSGNDFAKSFRCTNMDLTITTFDKEYIESTYEMNTGNPIDFGKSAVKNILSYDNPKVENLSENATLYIVNTRVNGQIDTDVAGIYDDNDHFIIVEGGDVELVEQITKSIIITNP